ncbi:MAG: glycoside hydrolase family 31 protein [Eubacteriales bacterium]|nr:glycoside hydrolase family 31 protein [Eubacteriales bacterium]
MEILQITQGEGRVQIRTAEGIYGFFGISDAVMRLVFTKKEEIENQSLMIEPSVYESRQPVYMEEDEAEITVFGGRIKAVFSKETGAVTWTDADSGEVWLREAGREMCEEEVVRYTTGGEPPVVKRVKTVDGERSFIENLKQIADRKAYRAKLYFDWEADEGIYGLGQAEEGVYNYRHHSQYLYQHNMRIPMPMFVSSKNYGILVDCCSLMTFQDDENGSYLFLDTVDQMDYYFLAGEKLDDVIDGYRRLTGKAALLPKWAYGYVQSKEAYRTADELLEIGKAYRESGVPLDCIVQDWNTWEPGIWGEKTVDKTRYANIREVNEKLHEMNIHTMVSVWPNMAEGGENHREFVENNQILGDFSTYDAFDEKAREVYWKQAKEGLFDEGFDSWWCDSTEPFSGPDWGGQVKREPWERYALVGGEHKKYLDAAKANAFALMHAKGIFENQRKDAPDKRVLNLTRSGYASQQKYGVMLWSGDIYASWKTLKRQITEGLNMAMSGMPYWTLDIGAFFVVGSAWQKRGCGCNTNPDPLWFWKGEYNDGVEDLGYRELYTRWFEFGTFLPMHRSHGTDTPREIWNFGEPGTPFYDALKKYIELRYQLMPYIYSLAGSVTLDNATIMRSLLFDFGKDPKAKEIGDEYLFGPSFLVCPVTEPMYYEAGSKPIDREKTWRCYLPKGAGWYHYWSGKKYEGGQYVTVKAELGDLPLFVKAGSILPMNGEKIQYAAQPLTKPVNLRIYPGADAAFTLYEDAGDGYGYEQGEYCRIPLTWDDSEKCLTIHEAEGSYPGMPAMRTFTVTLGDIIQTVSYDGAESTVSFRR